jgi:hypothetical protein
MSKTIATLRLFVLSSCDLKLLPSHYLLAFISMLFRVSTSSIKATQGVHSDPIDTLLVDKACARLAIVI